MLHRKKSLGGRASGHSKRAVATAVGMTVEALERRQLLAAQLVSATPLGTVADLATTQVSVSQDGRYVAFTSSGTDFVPSRVDDNFLTDVYWRDTQTGVTRLVSQSVVNVNHSGDGASRQAVISPDGQFVAFLSGATDLVAGLTDANTGEDVFLYSATTQTVTCISVDPTGVATLDDVSTEVAMRDNGQHVAFVSAATNADAGITDTNGFDDVFVRNRLASTTTVVSVAAGLPTTATGESNGISISGSAPFRIAFVSTASDLVPALTEQNTGTDVFVYDSAVGQVLPISVMPSSTVTGSDISHSAAISFNGETIVYLSAATDLVGVFPDTNNADDVFVRDLSADRSELISKNFDGTAAADAGALTPILDDDGSHVVWVSAATDLELDLVDTGGFNDVFMRDRGLGVTTLVSRNSWGTIANGASSAPTVNSDGSRIAFVSLASNLATSYTDAAGLPDIFARDTINGSTRLISSDPTNTAVGNLGSSAPKLARLPITVGGSAYRVYFLSNANNLVADDFNFAMDLFRGQARQKQVAAAPINVQATNITTNSVDLSWTDNSIDEARFKVLRSDDGGVTWMIIYKVQANTTEGDTEVFTDTGLAAGQRYLYRVVAANDSGDSDFANTLQVDTNMPAVVAGTVWNDRNMNGVFDSNEVGLPGVTVFVDLDGDGLLGGTEPNFVSDVNGNYLLILIPPGTVNIRQIASADLLPTAPTSGIQTVSLGSGQVLTRLNFGLHNLAVNYSIEWDAKMTGKIEKYTTLDAITAYTGAAQGQYAGSGTINLSSFTVKSPPPPYGNIKGWPNVSCTIDDVVLTQVPNTNIYEGSTTAQSDNGGSITFNGDLKFELRVSVGSDGRYWLSGDFFTRDSAGNRVRVNKDNPILEGSFSGRPV